MPQIMAAMRVVLSVGLMLLRRSLIAAQAVYPSNLCGFPGPDEDLPIQCFYNNDPSGASGYACCPAKPGCCGSLGCCPFNGPVGPIPQGYCGTGAAIDFPTRCYFNSDPLHRYVCCDAAGCDGFNANTLNTPHCKNNGYVPPGFGLTPPPPPPTLPTPAPGTQGVCGTGVAANFPFRCYFNNDPAGRYICCDAAGCNGFSFIDEFYPKCAGSFYLPPNFGVGAAPATPPATAPPASPGPPSGSQGVCGTGAATNFPVRCYYNSDPQGRYVCCDIDGCDGFNPPENFFPHCKKNGYVPTRL